MQVSELKSMASFCFKRNAEFKEFKNLKSYIYYEPWHIRNPGIFVIRGYSEPSNIQKFNGF